MLAETREVPFVRPSSRRRLVPLLLIREAADPALSKADRGALVRALAGREHVGPDGERIRVGRSTVDRWIRVWYYEVDSLVCLWGRRTLERLLHEGGEV